ncbi:MAG TPA: hypothetical protein VME20_08455 [Acidimicrobiales bacterium]|nr:hypothetical protein [Acidimicrobiales bacterium]
MLATPAVSAPSEVKAGAEVRVSGSGFRAGSRIKIVLDTPRRVVVGSAQAQPDGTFKTAILVPRRAAPGAHRLQVVGTDATGRATSLAAALVVLTDNTVTAAEQAQLPQGGLAEPVLLTIAAVLPLTTWLVLEVLGWRNRRLGLDHRSGTRRR